ncbi:MAG TPA: hypothetical protein VEU62_23635 [Bryobacterales bacterium]|nr:hypothetical protein [Bryobacterales bacterium]
MDLSVKECPDCRDRAAAPAGPEQPAAVEEPPSSSVRFWLLLGLAAVVGVAVIAAIVRFRTATPAPAAAPQVVLDRPSAAAIPPDVVRAPTTAEPGSAPGTAVAAIPAPQPAAVTAESIEVAGIRMSYDSQNRPQVRALVINHGEAGLRGATLKVTLRPSSSASDAPPLATFSVRLASEIKPGESKEVRAPLDALATLAAMPAWRKLRADVALQ